MPAEQEAAVPYAAWKRIDELQRELQAAQEALERIADMDAHGYGRRPILEARMALAAQRTEGADPDAR